MADITQNLKQKYNKTQGNKGQVKKQRKNGKKALVNALTTSFSNAQSGDPQLINHMGNHFLLTKVKLPIESITHNGAPHFAIPSISSPEMEEYQAAYQKLLQTMQKLNYEQKDRSAFQSDEQHQKHIEIMERNEEIWSELDEMTFEFSEGYGKTPQQRKTIISKFNKVFQDNPILNQIGSGKVQK